MANGVLTIYKGCKITPDRNAMVDDIESYLGTLTQTYSGTIQYQELDLDIVVRIPKAQNYQSSQELGNYAKLVQDEKTYYWFIVDKPTPVSEKTIEVHLSMDTINTFTLGTDYTISNNSTILRQHKSRFKKITGTPTTGYSLLKSIDKEPEGLSGLTKIRKSKDKIQYTGAGSTWLNKKWYLVYKNDADDSYTCKLYPESDSDIPLYYQSGTNYYTVPTSGATYFFTRPDNGNFKLELDGTLYNMDDISLLWYYVGITYVSSNSKYTLVVGNEAGSLHTYTYTTIKIYANYYRTDGSAHTSGSTVRYISSLDRNIISTTGGLHYFTTVDTLDRTDTSYINIIECPYCPVLMTWDNNNQVVENGWFSIDKDNLTVDFDVNKVDFELTLTDNLTSLFTDTITGFSSADEMKIYARNIDDSKLLNSEITELKIGIGNESQNILLEHINTTNSSTSINANIKYKQTNQLSSEKVFNISIDDNNNTDIYTHIEDFDNIIFSNTNCEMPLINDNYIYYMRNGYNLDKQSMNRQKIGAITGITAGVIQSAGGLLSSSTPIGVATALNGITNTSQQIVNAISNTSMLEASLSQKISETQQQANSIRNVNNIDLVNSYKGGYLYEYIYKPTDKQISNLNDLFFYTGYAVNKKDSINLSKINTRYWFDYIEANVVFNSYNKAYNLYTDDIKTRYSLGITRYHCNTVEGVKTWDWNREYENWESGFNI